MNKMFRSLIGVVLALICVAPLHAQALGSEAADTNSSSTNSAPDDVMKKLSELVRAGKYAEAHQLTAALLLAFPDDQRLIKAKALLDQALVTAANKVVPPPPVAGTASVVAARTETERSSAPLNTPVPVAVAPASVPQTVILHLYRPHRLMGAIRKLDVYVDGNKITEIANSQAIQMVLAPGKHTISVSKRGIESEVPISNFDMKAGQEYWVRVEISTGAWAAHTKLFLVPSDQALLESNRMEEIKLENVSSN